MNTVLEMSDSELTAHYGDVMRELRKREIMRFNYSPVANLAKELAAKYYGVECTQSDNEASDFIVADGLRVQVKGVWRWRPDRLALEPIERTDFEIIVVVVFSASMQVEEALVIPKSVFERTAKWEKNCGWKLKLSPALRRDRAVKRLSPESFLNRGSRGNLIQVNRSTVPERSSIRCFDRHTLIGRSSQRTAVL
jgi:hypothetical protein